ncbi:hypothetical protein JXO59_05980 [candidate division KSB1 bacterium]|nr:hypothetical protein [candidate division KSB1 bacterium]
MLRPWRLARILTRSRLFSRFAGKSRTGVGLCPFVAAMLCCTLACFNPFAPSLDQNPSPDVRVTEQKTPDETLQNFIYAYTFKDSLVYDNLLDSSFVFVYFDPNLGTSGLFASWNRDIELKTTGRLFRNFETLNLVWDSTIYETLEETSAELAKTLHLHMFGTFGEFNLTGNAIFNFRKSPYDHKWRITRWKDESQM